MFTRMGVLNERELLARNEVKWEMYTKKIQIESRVLGDLAMNHIIPVATKYQGTLIDNVYKLSQALPDKAAMLSKENIDLIEQIAAHINTIKVKVEAMTAARKKANIIENEEEKANAYHDNVLPYFSQIREAIDHLELIVDNEMWTLPKYRELLFIR